MVVAAASRPRATASAASSKPTLKVGASGASVKTLQSMLTQAGFSTRGIDGSFGRNTLAAVKAFQRAHGLAQDGVVGPKTWSKLAQVLTPRAPASSSSTATVKLGSKGSAVKQLQQKLAAHGFNAGPADGIFGNGTLKALKAFQSAKGLSADGVAGPKTWAKLNEPAARRPGVGTNPVSPMGSGPLLKEGHRGAPVKQLQQRLTQLGFKPGPADGVFGNGTEAAVKAFQRAKGLTADGVVGLKTWAKLGIRVTGTPTGSTGSTGSTGGVASGPLAARMARVLEIGRAQVGTLESGKNAGAITKFTGGKTGWPYCAKFVSWVYRQAGMPLPGGDQWAVRSIKASIERMGQWTNKNSLQPGMVATFSSWSHIEIIAKPVHQNGRLTGYMTIGGNTTIPGTGREGVAYKFRSLSELQGGGYPVNV